MDPNAPPAPTPGPTPQAAAVTNQFLRVLSPGLFGIGDVRLDRAARTVRLPAAVNSAGGPIEYFLVTSYGKTHESVLRTDAMPFQIHIAMLLLDAGGGSPSPAAGDGGSGEAVPPRGPMSEPWRQPIRGDLVSIEVTWEKDGQTVCRRGEELVFNRATGAPMTAGDWVYNGSFVVDGVFRAELDGSVASVIADPTALINTAREGADNDDLWTICTNVVPPMGTPVEVTLRLKPRSP